MRSRDLGNSTVTYIPQFVKTYSSTVSSADAWEKALALPYTIPARVSANKTLKIGLINDSVGSAALCNFVEHNRETFRDEELRPYGYVRYYPTYRPPRWTAYVYRGSSVVPTWEPSPTFSTIDLTVMDRAWVSTRPDADSDFSGINFLKESPELAKLVPQLISIISALTLSKKFLRRQGRKASKKPLNELTLVYSFGIMPTIGDFKALWDLLLNCKTSYQKFLSRGKIPMPYRYVEKHEPTVSNYGRTGAGYLQRTETAEDHVTFWCTYEYEGGPMQYLLDTFGLMPSFEALWNGLPWTFVVDWVFKFGDFLHQFKNSRTIVTIQDQCLSRKTVISYQDIIDSSGTNYPVNAYSAPKIDPLDNHNPCAWTMERAVYSRSTPAWKPGAIVAPELSGLSGRELVLSAALLRSFL